MDAGQLFFSEKSLLFAPIMAIELMVRVALAVLVKVETCGLPVILSGLPKLRLEGDSVTIGPKPTPVSGTDCGLPSAFSVIVTAPLRVPVAVGVKVTAIMQLDPEAKSPPTGQLLV